MIKVRTSIWSPARLCTGNVRIVAPRHGVPWLLGLAFVQGCLLTPAQGSEVAGQRRQEARGWLQLDQGQRAHRERVEPLPPGRAATLEGLEQRQRLRLRELQMRQQRARQSERRTETLPERERSSVGEWSPGDRRDMDRQRLEMQLQRDNLGLGRPWSPRKPASTGRYSGPKKSIE